MLQSIQDTTRAAARAAGDAVFDTVWTDNVPTAVPSGLEQVMLAQDKLYVVLAVVLLIWGGLMLLVFSTDRRLRRVEQQLEDGIPVAPKDVL